MRCAWRAMSLSMYVRGRLSAIGGVRGDMISVLLRLRQLLVSTIIGADWLVFC
jgi:hypothetical protein